MLTDAERRRQKQELIREIVSERADLQAKIDDLVAHFIYLNSQRASTGPVQHSTPPGPSPVPSQARAPSAPAPTATPAPTTTPAPAPSPSRPQRRRTRAPSQLKCGDRVVVIVKGKHHGRHGTDTGVRSDDYWWIRSEQDFRGPAATYYKKTSSLRTVSYTHLTLPTIYSV